MRSRQNRIFLVVLCILVAANAFSQAPTLDSSKSRAAAVPTVTFSLDFPNADPSLLPALQATADKIRVPEYSQTALQAKAHELILPVYLARGYLKGAPRPVF